MVANGASEAVNGDVTELTDKVDHVGHTCIEVADGLNLLIVYRKGPLDLSRRGHRYGDSVAVAAHLVVVATDFNVALFAIAEKVKGAATKTVAAHFGLAAVGVEDAHLVSLQTEKAVCSNAELAMAKTPNQSATWRLFFDQYEVVASAAIF